MKKTIFKKIRRYAFITVNYCALFVFMFSLCSVDSDSWIPFWVFIGSGIWLLAAAWLWDNTTLFDRVGDD